MHNLQDLLDWHADALAHYSEPQHHTILQFFDEQIELSWNQDVPSLSPLIIGQPTTQGAFRPSQGNLTVWFELGQKPFYDGNYYLSLDFASSGYLKPPAVFLIQTKPLAIAPTSEGAVNVLKNDNTSEFIQWIIKTITDQILLGDTGSSVVETPF
jgi:hypothetical protein